MRRMLVGQTLLFLVLSTIPALSLGNDLDDLKLLFRQVGYKTESQLSHYTTEDLASDYARMLQTENRSKFFSAQAHDSTATLFGLHWQYWNLAGDLVKIVIPYDRADRPLLLNEIPEIRKALRHILDLDSEAGQSAIIRPVHLLELFNRMPLALTRDQKMWIYRLLGELYKLIDQDDLHTRGYFLDLEGLLLNHPYLDLAMDTTQSDQITKMQRARIQIFHKLGSVAVRKSVILERAPALASYLNQCSEDVETFLPLLLAVTLEGETPAPQHLRHLLNVVNCEQQTTAFVRSVYGSRYALALKLARQRRLILSPHYSWSIDDIQKIEVAAQAFPVETTRVFAPHLVLKNEKRDGTSGYIFPYLNLMSLGKGFSVLTVRHEMAHIWDETHGKPSYSESWLALSGWVKVRILDPESETYSTWLPTKYNFSTLYGATSPSEDFATSMEDQSVQIPEKTRALEARGLEPRAKASTSRMNRMCLGLFTALAPQHADRFLFERE